MAKTPAAPPANKPPVPSVWDSLEVPIAHDGNAITLPSNPEDMPLKKAVEALKRRIADDDQDYQVHERFDAFPHDAAVAFAKAIHNLYGFASFKDQPTFFGPVPPSFLAVKVGLRDDEVVQCPVGQFNLPGVDEPLTSMLWKDPHSGRTHFLVHGVVKKKNRHVILRLVTETKRILRDQSIYRGKAIRLSVSNNGDLDYSNPPLFLDVSDIDGAQLIFDAELQAQIDTNILVPLRHTDACRQHGIPLKRGILLEGPYGTGKSLLAKWAARVASDNGWTFVLLDRVQGLREALEFATRYAPAVVFAEDIDRAAHERDDATNDLINIIDGVHTKNVEIMTILTTNHVEKLDKVILRPGRLDAVISIRAPSANAVRRLIRHYAGNLLDDKTSISSASKALEGQIPASIRECVERAKLGMIGRKATSLSDSDLTTAAETMKNHLALLAPQSAEPSDAEKLANSLHAVVNNGFGKQLEVIQDKVEDIQDRI